MSKCTCYDNCRCQCSRKKDACILSRFRCQPYEAKRLHRVEQMGSEQTNEQMALSKLRDEFNPFFSICVACLIEERE